jgi:geranylgeranyl diphosphate synthase type II
VTVAPGSAKNPSEAKLPAFFEEDRIAVDVFLDRLLPAQDTPPASIHEAMRYSVLAGGKRIRPVLCIEAARIFSANENTSAPKSASGNGNKSSVDSVDPALYPACAIEFIHTYSLIHDDLPALDNDDLRRGKPTSHIKFGDAIAILAGDALLTKAFETIAATPVDHTRIVAMLVEIATAAGTVNGMVGGQVADIESENKKIAPEMLEYIHRSKTAALIRASVTAGALCAGAKPKDVTRFRTFGENIGWAFQVIDDILDVEESSAALGKTAGKDLAQHKATYPAIHGLKRSHEIAKDLATRAIAALDPYGAKAAPLRDIAEFLILRRA